VLALIGPSGPPYADRHDAAFQDARDLVDAARARALDLGKALSIAVVDETPFHRLCADFPADPAARLPLERIKPGLIISLGVVDVSCPDLEEVDALLDRVDPVVEQRGDLDVAIATNAGFAASADRPLLSEDAQQAKLRLVETVARYYWGNEI
jgi:5-methyltetrahydropteroyltriglutamate--homocysteine methyltransferase